MTLLKDKEYCPRLSCCKYPSSILDFLFFPITLYLQINDPVMSLICLYYVRTGMTSQVKLRKQLVG